MPGVAGQLVQVLSAPRPLANGTYTVTVQLHPESLGTVQATVTASAARVSVQLVAGTNAGAEAIAQSLSELHEALSAGGQPATVSVSSGGAQGSSTGDGAGGTASGPGQQSQYGTTPQQGAPSTSRGARTTPVRAAISASAPPSGRDAAGGRLVDVRV